MKKIKILFVRPYNSSFIQKDLELLKNYFDVRVLDFVYSKENLKGTLNTFFKLFLFTLWADLTFAWFADKHAYWSVRISKFLKKRSIVVIGGYEVANIPEIGYGTLSNPKLVGIVTYVLDNADRLLAVDNGLKKDAMEKTKAKGDNFKTIPTGYDYNIFKPYGKKENLVLTISSGDYWGRVQLKGLDIFVKSAKFLINTKFLIIGINGEALRKLEDLASPNVEFNGPISQQDLIPYYQKAKVYCQLSMREGLPNALCEAMLCECVPVGTDVQGVKTAIGDAGFYVPYGDVKATAEAITKAMKSDKGKDARERIKRMFPRERREKELIETINEVLVVH